jgi:hypothetical protein
VIFASEEGFRSTVFVRVAYVMCFEVNPDAVTFVECHGACLKLGLLR